MEEQVYDVIPSGDEEAAIIETRSTDSLDTNVTTSRSILSRVNERIIETQINLHETVGDWGVRTENILALFWGGIVFFIGLSFNIAQANTTLDSDRFATIYWVLFSFMLVGIIFMAVTLHHRENENIFVHDVEEDEPSDSKNILKSLLWTVFVFALGLYLMDMLSIVNVFHCGFGNGVSSQEDDQYASIFVYHVTRFIFVSLQLFLLQFLIGAKVRRSGYYQFAVKVLCMHVIVTNVTIWLTKFCQETGLFGGNNPSGEYDSLNCTLNIGDTFYDVTKRMDHILGPFVLEFCLISVGLFYTLYPLLRDTQMIGKSAAASSGYGGYKYKAVNIIKDATKSYRSMPSLILGCFFALLLVVSAWNLKNIDNRIQNLRFSFMVQIIVFLLILLFCRLTLHQLKEHHRQEQHDQTYNVEDVLLILSGPLGFLPFSLLVLFASFAYKEDDNHLNDFTSANQTEIRVWSALWAIASVVSVFVQTHFLIVGRHFKRDVVEERTRRSTEDISDDTHYISRVFSAGKINQFIIVLSMCNFGIWFMESFFEVDTTLLLPDEYSPFDIVQEFSPFVIPREYWGYNAWNIIKKLLYPFLIFYRLHCVAIMIHIWRKFQIKH